MNKLSRILTMLLCCAPLSLVYAGPVATTNGSNLTSFNPSNANNNQWATISNGRYDGNNTSAKANFGNCNSIVLRCAQPKCGNGGCSDLSVAANIVDGCIKSNESCKQYGADLVNYMSAQLVASSNAKINEQQLAAQQAAAAAQAQATAVANAQSQQQMQQMQQQMQQMQQQMQQQQYESQQQLQAALAQQAAQSQAALEEMKTAATNSAMQNEAGISSYQQDAINRGISADVLERQTMTGQIMTEIEDAETSVTTLKKTLRNVFEYAHCDDRGNNCEGPKRVKKWREMAKEFVDPYENVIDKIYDAISDAQMLGVDISQIYMMLDDSCSRWGQYMCPQMTGGQIVYGDVSDGQKGTPRVCSTVEFVLDKDCDHNCYSDNEGDDIGYKNCLSRNKCAKYREDNCKSCTLLKVLADQESVYNGWVEAEGDASKGNTTVVACASGVLDASKFFARRAKRKKGANLVDIEDIETWLNQVEPGYRTSNFDAADTYNKYCNAANTKEYLEKAAISKTVPVTGTKLCVDTLGSDKANTEECPFISPVYAICDTHPYNAGYTTIEGSSSTTLTEQVNKTKEIVGLKVTVISQQMWKQFEYLNATLRRLKIQLEKAIVKTNLEAAGATTDNSVSSSGGLLGGNSSGNDDKTIYLAGANNCLNFMDFDSAYNCLQTNVSLITSNASGSNYKNACLQLQTTLQAARTILQKDQNQTITGCENITPGVSKSCSAQQKTDVTACAQAINIAVMNEKRTQSQATKKINMGNN